MSFNLITMKIIKTLIMRAVIIMTQLMKTMINTSTVDNGGHYN